MKGFEFHDSGRYSCRLSFSVLYSLINSAKVSLCAKPRPTKLTPRLFALMLASDNAYSLQAYQNEELKSLPRYRFDKVGQRSKLKQSLSPLATILFPELESAVSNLHLNSIYAMLLKYPSAKDVVKS